MLNRTQIVEILDGLYAARVKRDKETFGQFWAQGATYQMSGDAEILGETLTQPKDAIQATSELIDNFHFHSAKLGDVIVEGNKAALVLDLTVSTDGGPTHETRVFNLWEFDEKGKVLSLIEFADTALVSAMIARQDGDLRTFYSARAGA